MQTDEATGWLARQGAAAATLTLSCACRGHREQGVTNRHRTGANVVDARSIGWRHEKEVLLKGGSP